MTVMTSQRNADLLRRLPEVLHRWIRARGSYLVSLDQLRSLPGSRGRGRSRSGAPESRCQHPDSIAGYAAQA